MPEEPDFNDIELSENEEWRDLLREIEEVEIDWDELLSDEEPDHDQLHPQR